MLMGDPKDGMVKSEVEKCKREVTLDPGHVDKHSAYTGHKSAAYGEGGPAAGGPQKHAPGTGGKSSGGSSYGY